MPKSTVSTEIKNSSNEFAKSVAKVSTLEEVYKLRSKYLGKESTILSLLSKIPTLPPQDRSIIGALINSTKKSIESKIEQTILLIENKDALAKDKARDIDVTAPFSVGNNKIPALLDIGSIHPIQQEINRLLDIFRTMGFTPFEARELDSDYYVFDSLNIPENHPARQNWDTFRTEDNLIPTPHTSNMQVRIMRYIKKAPLRAVIYGRCARNEAVDAVHGHTFYQIEGLYIDKGVSISNMIGTIKTFVESYFERKIEWRIQPGYFPFVEPAIEFMVKCVFCEGIGCASCKHVGWLEMLGAGMIHPNVLKEGGFDPKIYTGFAWGLGLDRMVMQKNKIKDIRSLFGSDIRFLSDRV